MKVLTLVALLLASVGVANAKGFSFEEIVQSNLLLPNESIADFTARMKVEITCDSLRAKLAEYQESRAAVDNDLRASYGYISQSLDRWDNELWGVSGRVLNYTGALGKYARKVDNYAAAVATNLTKLQIFTTTFDAKLPDCVRPRQN